MEKPPNMGGKFPMAVLVIDGSAHWHAGGTIFNFGILDIQAYIQKPIKRRTSKQNFKHIQSPLENQHDFCE